MIIVSNRFEALSALRRMVSLAVLILGLSAVCGAQANIGDIADILASSGYTNVRSYEDETGRVITLQNDAYKLQASGLANALRLIEAEGLPTDKTTTVIATDYNVPKVSLTYVPVLHRWVTSYRLDESWDKVRKEEKRNSSLGKVDLVVYPQVSLMNLIITQVYQSLWDINPTVEAELWPGAKVSAQVKIPVYNDGYGSRESKVHPGMMTLSQSFRVPWNVNVFGKASLGTFSNSRYGAALELFYPFPNERFSLESQLGMLGLYYWDGFVFHMGDSLDFFWNFGVGYYWPQNQTRFTLKVQKFLLYDYGLKYEMTRHFRHCSVGFYAEKGFYSDTHTNGGFRFMISLPPYRMTRYRSFPRVTAGSIGMVYNANNEQRWYKEYKTEYGQNIMTDNAFNPYYIDSEIVKLNHQ